MRFLQARRRDGFERYDTGASSTARPSVETVFTPAQMPGIGADPDYVHAVRHRGHRQPRGRRLQPDRHLLAATLHDYRQQNDGPFSFRRTDAIARQLIPILHGNWVIDLSVCAPRPRRPSDGERRAVLPDADARRRPASCAGIGNYRFRDRNSLLFTAEYRWYAQEFVEMALFYDAGKVTARRADLDFDGLKSDFGIGLRMHGAADDGRAARGRQGPRRSALHPFVQPGHSSEASK